MDIHIHCYHVSVCVSLGWGSCGLYSATPVCWIHSQPIVLKFSHNSTVSSPKQSPYHGPKMTRLCGPPQRRLIGAECTQMEVSE